MNIYGLLGKFVENLSNETDKAAGRELILKLRNLNAFGSAALSVESDTKETGHEHVRVTEWDMYYPGMLHDICGECGIVLRNSYDPPVNNSPSWRGARY